MALRRANYISDRMRRMTKLLLEGRKLVPETSMEDFLCAPMVDVVLQATHTLSGTDGFDTKAPYVANKIREDLSRLASAKEYFSIKAGDSGKGAEFY